MCRTKKAAALLAEMEKEAEALKSAEHHAFRRHKYGCMVDMLEKLLARHARRTKGYQYEAVAAFKQSIGNEAEWLRKAR